ncbi:hypothetical protein [Carboxylicivirga caseinilyticus]|uniref:hypothetical protein n=1 Tax=Carboxylicivirga caseinilyticus TaxID=3417572 RepID=UPI0029C8318E|nr:hypothetical protein [uncultured Carboxylicivirga sp.]MCU4165719.1 hypothetical protein [Marinilabiliaceae bacterium A049]
MQLDKANKAALITTGIKFGVPVVVAGIGFFAIRKIIKGKKNTDGTSSRIAPSIKDTVIEKANLTISTSDAALFANTLYGAMLDFGTDEKTIFSTMDKINSKDDMLLVIKAFGMKQYLWGGRAAFLGQDYNLIGWLRAELSESEISKIKPKFDSWGIPL